MMSLGIELGGIFVQMEGGGGACQTAGDIEPRINGNVQSTKVLVQRGIIEAHPHQEWKGSALSRVPNEGIAKIWEHGGNSSEH